MQPRRLEDAKKILDPVFFAFGLRGCICALAGAFLVCAGMGSSAQTPPATTVHRPRRRRQDRRRRARARRHGARDTGACRRRLRRQVRRPAGACRVGDLGGCGFRRIARRRARRAGISGGRRAAGPAHCLPLPEGSRAAPHRWPDADVVPREDVSGHAGPRRPGGRGVLRFTPEDLARLHERSRRGPARARARAAARTSAADWRTRVGRSR